MSSSTQKLYLSYAYQLKNHFPEHQRLDTHQSGRGQGTQKVMLIYSPNEDFCEKKKLFIFKQ